MKKIMDSTLLLVLVLFVISCATVKQAEEPVSVTASPTEVSAEAGNGKVTIRWNGVTGAESYSIYMSGSEGTSKKNFDGRRSTTATSYSWAGLTNGTSYYFVVTALKKDKESSDSKEVTATPKAPEAAPKPPKEPPKAAEPELRRPRRSSRNLRERLRRPLNQLRKPPREAPKAPEPAPKAPEVVAKPPKEAPKAAEPAPKAPEVVAKPPKEAPKAPEPAPKAPNRP